MIRSLTVHVLGGLLVTAGCTQEQVKRTTYETLQNIREQKCSRTPSVDCEKRETLEVYEDRREQVLQE